MNTHRSLLLLFVLMSMSACKKESSLQPMSRASAEQSISSAQCVSCPAIDPSNFVKGINNPYLPWVAGTSYHYVIKTLEGNETSTEHQYVTVTSDIKIILGVPCTVVHDVVKQNGIVIEDTYDWYAQDKHGNVWYFGEDTKARTDTGWSTEGTWQAGVNGGCAGIVMFAHPENHMGKVYQQEYLKGVAEDAAKNLDTNVTVKIKYGTFTNCVVTAEFSRLEPGVIEHKYYAPGIGNILVVTVKGGHEREELVEFTH